MTQTAICRLPLERPLRPLFSGTPELLIELTLDSRPVAELVVSAETAASLPALRAAIADAAGDVAERAELEAAFRYAAGRRLTPRPTRVSVVISAVDASVPAACLAALTTLSTRPHEIVVIGGHGARAYAEANGARLFEVPGPPGAHERNQAARLTGGDVIAFIDADCIPDAGWLDGVGEAMADPLVAAVGGRIAPLALDSRTELTTLMRGARSRRLERRTFDIGDPPPAGVEDGNVAVRRSELEALGGFTEALGALPGRDGDLLARLAARGRRVVVDPAQTVRRPAVATGAALRRRSAGAAGFAIHRLIARRDPHGLRELGGLVRAAARSRSTADAVGGAAGVALGLAAARRRPQPVPTAPVPAPPRISAVHAEDPDLTVAIASRNRCEMLSRVVDALRRQSYPAERFELVVVLDDSRDRSAELLRAADTPFELTVIEQGRSGVGPARNRGVAAARRPVVVFLDDDIVPAPRFLAENAAAHRRASRPHLGLGYCPPVIERDDLWSLGVRAWWSDHFRRKAEPGHHFTHFDITDGIASIPRSLFLDSGGFDPRFGERRQDWEWGARLLARGVPVAYHPGAEGAHHLDTRFETALRQRRGEARADVMLATAHPHLRSAIALARFQSLCRRHLLAFEHPHQSERAALGLLPAVQALDRLRLVGPWRSLVGRLLVHAYLLGAADALGSADAVREFIAAGGEPASVQFELERAAPLARSRRVELPRDGRPVEFELRAAGQVLARVPASKPDEQWDWERVTAEAVDAALLPFMRAVLDGPPLEPPTPLRAGDRTVG